MSELQKRALLVDLSIRSWAARNTDKEATRKVADDAGAERESVSVTKRLVDRKYIADIASLSQEIRFTHYRLTLPWTNDGVRLLPVELHQQYEDRMRNLIDQRVKAIGAFVEQYEHAVDQARVSLGDLFRAEDYPSPPAITGKFGCEYRFSPVPNGAHFVADVGDRERERIRADIEKHVEARVSASVGDVYARLHKAVAAISERLADREDGKTSRIKNTAIESLRELVETAKAMNISSDPALAKMCDEIRLSLAGVDTDQLRPRKKEFDQQTRDRVRKDLRDMKERLAGFMPAGGDQR